MGDECLTDLVWRDAGVTADSHILLVSAVVGAPRQMAGTPPQGDGGGTRPPFLRERGIIPPFSGK